MEGQRNAYDYYNRITGAAIFTEMAMSVYRNARLHGILPINILFISAYVATVASFNCQQYKEVVPHASLLRSTILIFFRYSWIAMLTHSLP